ncbi:MAG: hypothetical protein KF678_08235 [Phycisphaeraceae bacterium]|nr:hypothetical protein [Phycisphaeraceae bacterium]
MPRSSVDPTIERVTVDGFSFPLGVYPVEAMKPKAGYTMEFEPADGDNAGDVEEWPDRYVFDIVISSDRLEALCRSLMSLFPGRIYPILDVLGHDAYREVDPYISHDLYGLDRYTDFLRRFRAYFFEDGLCGFGLMTDEPFLYMFVDEHKIVTFRCQPEMKEKVERVLHAFDLEQMDDPAGADSASHEHRGVLMIQDNRPDLLNHDEILEMLRDEWRLVLNVDPDANLDENGQPLGVTPWRCLVRLAMDEDEKCRYADILLTAGSLREAEDMAVDACAKLLPRGADEWDEASVIHADRLVPEDFQRVLGERGRKSQENPEPERIIWCEWLE